MSGGKTRISIVMPNYNKGEFAEIAAKSVLAQPDVRLELIFVDDASTDGSADAVQALPENGTTLKVISLPENSGGAAARNIGIAEASGSLLLFMDSDDIMAPRALAEAVDLFEPLSEFDFAVFPMGYFNRCIGDDHRRCGLPSEHPALPRFFERDHPWLICSPLWRREFIEKIGGFDENLTSQQDFDLHVRALIEGGRYRHFESPTLVHYRMEVDSIPRSTSQTLPALRMRARMVRNHIERMADKEIEDCKVKRAAARYLLDVAQMLRWHKPKLGIASTREALEMWVFAHEYSLVSPREYTDGMGYIRFKHNMVWNRFPQMQQRLEQRYRRKLGYLIAVPVCDISQNTPADA
ncbi:MAG: glycosyltransferase family 2 protein [Cryomorphaceae bacterium]